MKIVDLEARRTGIKGRIQAMTRQVGDRIDFRDTEYSIEAVSNSPLFDPHQLGLHPVMASTACWDGCSISYGIRDDRLVLESLRVYLESEAPVINGISPVKCPPRSEFSDQYDSLNLPIPFTGGMLIARNYVGFKVDLGNMLYDMGDPPPWHYEQLIELSFQNGSLMGMTDMSSQMRKIRDAFTAELKRTGDRSYPSLDGKFEYAYPNL